MSLHSRLSAIVGPMPDDGSVTLTVAWLQSQLEAEQGSDPGVLGDLTLKQVGDALDRSVSTIRSWCNSGRIAGAYKLGRQWKIPQVALHSLRENGAPAAGRPSLDDRHADLGAWRREREGAA